MSERTIVCARATHPAGYGYFDADMKLSDVVNSQYKGKAHGYVLLFVTQVADDEVNDVVRWLELHDVRETFAPSWREWYGGRFESVAVFEGAPLAGSYSPPWVQYNSLEGHDVRSLGDNRAYAVVTWRRLREVEEKLELG